MRRTVLIAIAFLALAEVAVAVKGGGRSAQPNARNGSRANGRSSSRDSRKGVVDEDLREKQQGIQQKRSQKRRVEETQPLDEVRVGDKFCHVGRGGGGRWWAE